MNIDLNQIPNSDTIFIPVPSEKIKGDQRPTTISCDGDRWEIIDQFTYSKNETIPMGFMQVIMGKPVKMENIWKKYPNSEALIVYACKPILPELKETNEKAVKVPNMLRQ